MLTINLQQLKFYSYHGFHEEENILGNEYLVDAVVQFHETQQITELGETINYTRLYEIIRQRMSIPSKLLEPLAMDIGNAMKEEFFQLQAVTITITKVHPPIAGFEGSVAVTWHKEF
ncbi:MAG: dihydroneopterin aldolase [Ginsengibacter sp.]